MDDVIEAAAKALYEAPVSTFVAERKRLATEARAAGLKTAATAIAKLPKPSVSAWVVNQLHREGALAPLFAAATRVRAGELAAAPDQRAAIAQLRARAAQLLESDEHGASPAVIQRITTTLHALAAVGSFAPDAPGRLVADRDPPGFEAMAGVKLTSPPPPEEREEPAPEAKPRPPEPDTAAIALAAKLKAQRERAAAAARQVVADRRADVRQVRSELARAEATVTKLRDRLGSLEAELSDAETAADAAQAALDETVR